MMRTKLSKVLALFLALVMACSSFSFAAVASDTAPVSEVQQPSGKRTMQEWNEILNTIDYEEYLDNYAKIPRGDEAILVDATAYVADATTDTGVQLLTDKVAEMGQFLHTSASGKVTWTVTVPEDGMYTLEFECYPGDQMLEPDKKGIVPEKATDVERILYINGKVPFSEARSLTITKRWEAEYIGEDNRFEKDAAGNDIRPETNSAVLWTTYTAKDSTGYYKDALEFYFAAGENTIALEATREPLGIKAIVLKPAEEKMTYVEYLEKHTGADIASAEELYLPYLEENSKKTREDYDAYVADELEEARVEKADELLEAEKESAKEAKKAAEALVKEAEEALVKVEKTLKDTEAEVEAADEAFSLAEAEVARVNEELLAAEASGDADAKQNAQVALLAAEEALGDAIASQEKAQMKKANAAAEQEAATAALTLAQEELTAAEDAYKNPIVTVAAVAVLSSEDFFAEYPEKTADDHKDYIQAEKDAAIAANENATSAAHIFVDVQTYEEYLEKNLKKKAPAFPEYYDVYLSQFTADKKGQAEISRLEMELPVAQSDKSIYPLTDRTSAITSPQDPKLQLLNFMGGNENFKTVGQWAEYTFEVPENGEGFYTIAIRYKQNDISGMFASRALYIDGELPFAECADLRFNYSKDWQVGGVTDGTSTFEFYLKPGKHTLRMEVSLGQFADIIRQVESSLTNINGCYLDIMKLTGADPDEYRDYGFDRLMPKTIQLMLIESRNLYKVSEQITAMTGEKGSQTATLDKVAFLLDRMGRDEDEIAPNLDNLKTYIGTLGTWLNSVRSQPVRMDYIQIQSSETELPRENATFFEAVGFEFQAFYQSFLIDYSTMGAKETDETNITESIEVWTTEGRDQAKILKNLVAGEFTAKTGIGVNVKLVAGGTLLPSVLSGQGPDAFLGAGGTEVINYAIRSAVLPLNDYEGFDDAISQFHESTVKPVTLYGTTYGMPERVAFAMMFVRIDILADLGLEVPKTWDDVLAMLPVLQANNMSIGLNKDYDIFLYQMGGDRFADDGLRCGLDSNIALEAFEKYTRFYTDYSFPYTFDGPNRFRTGEMPILIADYSSTYNQLTVFATEINGLWEMTTLPGTVREDGTINYNAVNAIAATIMLHGTENEEDTWQFIRWFCGKDAQAAYGSDLVTTIGQAAKYNTANREAIKEMPWTTRELAALSDQFNHLSAIENYPGAYIFARYLNFAQLAVVNNGVDPVTELQSYVTTINKEITRKRSEFDLPTLEPGKTYATSPEVKQQMDDWLATNGRFGN